MSESADRDRIVKIARAYAREAGRDVDRYEVAGVKSETARHFVLFHAPPARPATTSRSRWTTQRAAP